MFRRQTDEVFSTLQQVQRRLSQHTDEGVGEQPISRATRQPSVPARGGPSSSPASRQAPASRPSPARKESPPPRKESPPPRRESTSRSWHVNLNAEGQPPPAHVRTTVDRSRMGKTAASLPTAEDQDADAYDAPMPKAQTSRRPGFFVTPQLASILVLIYIASVIGAYSLRAPSGEESVAGANPAPGGAGSRSADEIADQQRRTAANTSATMDLNNQGGRKAGSGAEPLGDYVLVLESYRNYSAKGEERFRESAKTLNEMAVRYANRGYKPWFGVRRPSSGGLQLVFGAVDDGVFGVPNDDDLGKRMHSEMRKARFKDALWVRIH